MTYRAAQLHNGTVDFVSEVGRGTTFRLQLPSLVPNHHV
jgi:signal transduction histidine kinase